ncbi:MAG TPA: ABC transporter ATP-binding protein [Candidatus Solibacter sp.]|nr:ABC transporter ATP-binding protein [Candidatus Solibacter sp.]
MLQICDLYVELAGSRAILRGVSLKAPEASITGLFGDSGCGKSTLALAILGLLPPAYRVRGEILFRGRNLTALAEREWSEVRGAQIAMIFQDPLLALNPVLRVRTQLTEILRAHEVSRDPAELLALAGLRGAERILDSYPHQLSGGERQRVTIAQALACRPALIIADEPFTALDPPRTVELIALFRRLRADLGTSFLLISHSPGVLATAADQTYRLAAGRLEAAQPTGALDA